ncbi:hypothetical protein [Actinomadura sp. NPDC049753]|uniref:hypothetical protein n=1 Tax=Actinomadura sp. NPDC049753 TaxID=3154739 RepID=UPI00342A8CF2
MRSNLLPKVVLTGLSALSLVAASGAASMAATAAPHPAPPSEGPAAEAAPGNPPVNEAAVAVCRKALDDLEVREGVCFWSGQGFSGDMSVYARPSGTDTCGSVDPVKSAVNLTRETRLLYAFYGCNPANFIAQVEPNEARSQFGPDTNARSWR